MVGVWMGVKVVLRIANNNKKCDAVNGKFRNTKLSSFSVLCHKNIIKRSIFICFQNEYKFFNCWKLICGWPFSNSGHGLPKEEVFCVRLWCQFLFLQMLFLSYITWILGFTLSLAHQWLVTNLFFLVSLFLSFKNSFLLS